MTNKKYFAALIPAVALFLVSALPVRASEWNHLTKLMVHQTIRVPGATLTPGTYWVKLVNSPADRDIVQFWNADQDKVLSTVIAVPDERMHLSGKTKLTFYEAPPGMAPALRTWFYPGSTYGDEFVYPKHEAMEIAHAANRNVPAMDETDMNRLSSNSSSANSAIEASRNSRVYSVTPQNGTMNYNNAETQNQQWDNNASARENTGTNNNYGEFEPNTNNANNTNPNSGH